MKEKEHYVIRIGESIVKVSQEVYYAYYQMQRQEQWQEEKKKDHNVLSYDALDDQETLGIESIVDVTAPTMDEILVAHELCQRVRDAIAWLPKAERDVIQAIYYKDLSEREVARSLGVSQNKIFKQRQRALAKLKMLLDNP